MPADFFSRIVVEAIDLSDSELQNEQDNNPICKSIKYVLQGNKPMLPITKKNIAKI